MWNSYPSFWKSFYGAPHHLPVQMFKFQPFKISKSELSKCQISKFQNARFQHFKIPKFRIFSFEFQNFQNPEWSQWERKRAWKFEKFEAGSIIKIEQLIASLERIEMKILNQTCLEFHIIWNFASTNSRLKAKQQKLN